MESNFSNLNESLSSLERNDASTIFALATSAIKSGVAIIRVSGSKAKDSIKIITKMSVPKVRSATLRKLYNPTTGDLIDEAVVLWFEAPASFTGEDTVEFHIHGSYAIIEELLQILSEIEGFRLALAGEFSHRSFLNGKMDLTQAEGLADLIDAETKMQARQALRQKQGQLRVLYDRWRKNLLSILANIEAYIDFPDEDIPSEIVQKIESDISGLILDISKHLDDNKCGEKLRKGLHVVILGAPNVGKSSFLNYLAKRDVAIVSDIAGTTRDVIEVHLNLGGYPVVIADTAGLRENVQAIESQGIEKALDLSKNSDLNLVMFDAYRLDFIDQSVFNIIDENSLVIINKADLCENLLIPEKLEQFDPLVISIEQQIGIDELLKKLENTVRENIGNISDPVITRQRHRSLLNDTVENLKEFSFDKEIEISAEDLRFASLALGRITGHIDTEEILGEIFSNFCIGK